MMQAFHATRRGCALAPLSACVSPAIRVGASASVIDENGASLAFGCNGIVRDFRAGDQSEVLEP